MMGDWSCVWDRNSGISFLTMDWANLMCPKASRKGYGLAPLSSCVLHWLLGIKMKMQPTPQTKKTKILFFKLGPLVGHSDPVPTTPPSISYLTLSWAQHAAALQAGFSTKAEFEGVHTIRACSKSRVHPNLNYNSCPPGHNSPLEK